MQQLSCDYGSSKDFGTKVKRVLQKIKGVQPNLIVKQEKGGMRIHSRPAIAPKRAKFYNIKDVELSRKRQWWAERLRDCIRG
jgi:hypothetical protein